MPEADSASVVVNIYGKNYTLALAREQTPEHVQQVAQLVDESMRQVSQTHRSPSPLQAAILAALNLVDELFKLQTDYQAAETAITQRTSRLTASLGRAFEELKTDAADSGRS